MPLSLRNGFIASVVAIVVGVLCAELMAYLLHRQSPFTREPIAQGVAMIAVWLSVWPWIAKHNSRLVQRLGFPGYAVWIVVGMMGITAGRLYLRLG